jgi:2,3-bisphosphoglycerate-independent phosphoglycerate mutase
VKTGSELCLPSEQVVTSDHGNAETMINEDGGPLTSHTTNPVPFIIANHDGKYKFVKDSDEGALCDVAPTCLDIMVSLERELLAYFSARLTMFPL